MTAFDDLLAANDAYAATFRDSGLTGTAGRGLAVLTCIDSRIDPLAPLGLVPGDAKILRNAGARVTDDALRTLVLAVYLLEVRRVLVMPHTDCGAAKVTDADVHAIAAGQGTDTRGVALLTVPDQQAAMEEDMRRIRSCGLLPGDTAIGGAVYDVHTGRLAPVRSLRD
jgi:carbonic anhydrase